MATNLARALRGCLILSARVLEIQVIGLCLPYLFCSTVMCSTVMGVLCDRSGRGLKYRPLVGEMGGNKSPQAER